MIKSYLRFFDWANQNEIAVVLVLVVLPIIKQEKLVEWHSIGVTRTRIRVIGENFIEIWS